MFSPDSTMFSGLSAPEDCGEREDQRCMAILHSKQNVRYFTLNAEALLRGGRAALTFVCFLNTSFSIS